MKCANQDGSVAISKQSIVHNPENLQERVNYITQTLGYDALVEEFIEGRELFVSILGHSKLKVAPVWELSFQNSLRPTKEIYSANAKNNDAYKKRLGVRTGPAKLSKAEESRILKISKGIYRCLHLSGYARLDFRYTSSGELHFIEANPNPIAATDEFALSAKKRVILF